MVNILHRVGIQATLDKVYQAIATPEGVAGWWTEQTSGEGRVGGTLDFRFSAGGAEIGHFTAKVLEQHANELVLWQITGGPEEWIGTTIRFELRRDGDYVIVLFRHEGWKEPVEFMHHCSTKWAIFMMSLKAFAETGTGRPSPNDVKIDNWN